MLFKVCDLWYILWINSICILENVDANYLNSFDDCLFGCEDSNDIRSSSTVNKRFRKYIDVHHGNGLNWIVDEQMDLSVYLIWNTAICSSFVLCWIAIASGNNS